MLHTILSVEKCGAATRQSDIAKLDTSFVRNDTAVFCTFYDMLTPEEPHICCVHRK